MGPLTGERACPWLSTLPSSGLVVVPCIARATTVAMGFGLRHHRRDTRHDLGRSSVLVFLLLPILHLALGLGLRFQMNFLCPIRNRVVRFVASLP
jgi:hypothetical protein